MSEPISCNTTAKNKRIAKNTLLLYGRMLLMMIISLYTSRVILNALGVEDYGIYNVVGGVVSMFSIISGTLSASISRFITFELGKGDHNQINMVFCTAVNVQFILIAIIVLLLETVGLWFLNYKLVIPQERMVAANWVFQFSIISFGVSLWSVPYNALIIAHEKMSAFAYISLFDSVARLAISFAILKSPCDRLVYYGILILLVNLFQRYLYTVYCRRKFEESRYKFMIDKPILSNMFGFAGWNFIGAASAVLRDQGGNIIINMFFGPSVNAARGIANSVNNAVSGFVNNFMTAINPQITKSYAVGDYEYTFKLVFQGARLSYYILLVMALPVFFTAPYLIELWLGIVPDHAVNFARLTLLFTLTESLANPLITIMLATGDIKKYQIIIGGLQLVNLPLYFVCLRLGFLPEVIFVISIIVSIISEFARLFMLKGMINLPVKEFLQKVYFNVGLVTLAASITPAIILRYYDVDNMLVFVLILVVTVVNTMISIYTLGCSTQDRELIHKGLLKIIGRIKRL